MFQRISDRFASEKALRSGDRLPLGQSLTTRFPVLHYGPVPAFDAKKWDFRIYGEVEREARWTWAEFNQLPRTKLTLDLHCVTRWSKMDTAWEGVHLRTLIEKGVVALKPAAKFVVQHCEFGFTTNIPVALALADNFLLATHYDGKPLDAEHGFPLRGVTGAVPERSDLKDVYLWKGGKWLRALEFRAKDQLGFWEQAGYHNEADIWGEQRFS